MLSKPIYKNNKYISTYSDLDKLLLLDVKIKSFHKFVDNKGYLMTIFIPYTVNSNIIESLTTIDNTSFDTIIRESLNWFNKELDEDELRTLYKPSYCTQNHTMNIIIANNKLTKYVYNDKEYGDMDSIIEIIKDIRYLKKCIINVDIQHYGLYFYKESANHKWIVKSINITDITNDKCICVKEDVEDKMEENVKKFIENTNSKIKHYKNTIELLNNSINDVKDSFKNLKGLSDKKWEDQLNKLNDIILMQEDNIINK